MIRGIHATLYARLQDSSVDLQALFEKRFAGRALRRCHARRAATPRRDRCARRTSCRIAVHRPQQGDTVVILSVIDNLVKGAAGQAVQNMNLMFGLPETTGLTAPPVVP